MRTFLPAPSDADERRARPAVVCYPVDTLPQPDMAMLARARAALTPVEEVIVPPRDARSFRVPAGQAYVPIEGPKGEIGCHIVSDGGTRPYRAHMRDPGFNHLQSVPLQCEGGMISDVIMALASIDPVMGGVDR